MKELLFVADPMCSWCWGFADTLAAVEQRLAPGIELRFVLGGLAPDSDEPMPDPVRRMVRGAWDAVEEATGACFNRDFWVRCEPRRSTYPACRAVLAAGAQSGVAGPAMYRAIQCAYYLEARNPSERATLVELAGELDPALDVDRFERELDAPETHAALERDLALCAELGVTGFPSLVARSREGVESVTAGWAPPAEVEAKLRRMGWV